MKNIFYIQGVLMWLKFHPMSVVDIDKPLDFCFFKFRRSLGKFSGNTFYMYSGAH